MDIVHTYVTVRTYVIVFNAGAAGGGEACGIGAPAWRGSRGVFI